MKTKVLNQPVAQSNYSEKIDRLFSWDSVMNLTNRILPDTFQHAEEARNAVLTTLFVFLFIGLAGFIDRALF